MTCLYKSSENHFVIDFLSWAVFWMQTQFNKSFANMDKNPPEDAIRKETISFVLSSHKKME